MNSGYVDICAKFQKILFNVRAKKWMSYEWSYDDIENEFFNKTDDFEQYLNEFFPELKTRQLTRSEWCRIRKYVNPQYKRLFSSKYLHEKRNELNQFRNGIISMQMLQPSTSTNCVKVDAEWNEQHENDLLASNVSSNATYADIQSTGDTTLPECESGTNFEENSDNHLFRLLIETSNYLSRKSIILIQIKQFMKNVQGDEATQSIKNEIGGKQILELYNLNTEILANFEKLWNFHQVKATLLYRSTTRIKTDHFYQKCQLAIFEKFRQLDVDSFQDYQVSTAVVESLLTLAYMLTVCESYSKETFTVILTDELKKLKILCGDEEMIFEQEWLPQLLLLFAKLTGTKQDMDKNIMQYIS